MTNASVRKTKRADELVVGDRLASDYVPHGDEAEVLFVRVHEYRGGERWVFVAYELRGGFHDSTSYRPDAAIDVTPAADPSGRLYTRADDGPDDPTPVSGDRIELHTGGMTDGGLVDETKGHFYIGDGVRGCDELLGGKVRCGAGRAQHPLAVTYGGLLAAPADRYVPGLIVGDTAEEQTSNAYAAYERDEAECPSAWHVNQGDKRSRCPICNQAD